MYIPRTVRQRLPLYLSICALLVAVLAATPALEAAARVAFANNAGAVNGIKASKKPKANQLLPLDARGRFPASVLARGPQGVQGIPGPQGAPGTTGPMGPMGPAGISHAIVRKQPTASTNLGLSAGNVNIIAVPNVAAGAYVVVFRADLVSFNTADFFRCEVVVPAGQVASGTVSAGGPQIGEAVGSLTITGGVTLAGPTTVTARCTHDSTVASTPYVESARLILLRVGALDSA